MMNKPLHTGVFTNPADRSRILHLNLSQIVANGSPHKDIIGKTNEKSSRKFRQERLAILLQGSKPCLLQTPKKCYNETMRFRVGDRPMQKGPVR